MVQILWSQIFFLLVRHLLTEACCAVLARWNKAFEVTEAVGAALHEDEPLEGQRADLQWVFVIIQVTSECRILWIYLTNRKGVPFEQMMNELSQGPISKLPSAVQTKSTCAETNVAKQQATMSFSNMMSDSTVICGRPDELFPGRMDQQIVHTSVC